MELDSRVIYGCKMLFTGNNTVIPSSPPAPTISNCLQSDFSYSVRVDLFIFRHPLFESVQSCMWNPPPGRTRSSRLIIIHAIDTNYLKPKTAITIIVCNCNKVILLQHFQDFPDHLWCRLRHVMPVRSIKHCLLVNVCILQQKH